MTANDRVILHVDLNCFYASVETVLNPALRGQPVAVCGSREDRHGIVLAKSEVAKRAGVKTGMTNGTAAALCPGLIIVPPHYSMYEKFSRLAKKIYQRYTNLVEPFGLDENWLDMTAGMAAFESPFALAEEIRTTVSRELGLTVSIGVSFNKVFAKLASDMKKPDAVTMVTRENYRTLVWRQPVEALLFVGHATAEKLHRFSVHTIGDLAAADTAFLRTLLGKSGVMLQEFACGHDTSRVMDISESVSPQSVGHGVTCNADITSDDEVFRIFLELAQDIGRSLREGGYFARGLQICVRDKTLTDKQFDTLLPERTQSGKYLAEAAFRLYRSVYRRESPIRALTIRATRLTQGREGEQYDFFYDAAREKRQAGIEAAMDDITARYGRNTIYPAAILLNEKTRALHPTVPTLPYPYLASGREPK